jgi:23S rRNA pseudouridine2605 synthase
MRKRISNDDSRRSSRPSEGRAPEGRSSTRSTGRSEGRSSAGRDFNGPRNDRNDSGAPREFRGPRNDSGAPRAPRSESSNRFSTERKPYNSEGGERKPYQGGERKPYQGGDRKPFNRDNREGGERRSFGDRKPFGRTENPTRTPYKGDNRWDRNATPKVEGSEESTTPRDENPTARIERKYEERTERSADRPERPEGDRNPRYSDRETFKSRSRFDAGPAYEPQYKLDRYKERAPAKIQKKIAQTERRSDEIRLNRYIANAGICSRRDADKLIEAGEIKVNNKVITEMGYQVKPTDIVKYGNRKLNREKPVYLLLNKPKDFLTTTDDPNDRKTVMELVKNATESRIYPVGRLDRNTTGLLLLTNDGELADKLTHPSNEIEKIYQAELDKPLTDEDFEKIKEGLTLEDGEIKVDDLAKVTPDGYVIGVKIHSGKNRIVRRIFEHLGYEVTKLDRTTFSGLTKKDLPRGSWRFLTERELVKLKYLM